MSLNPPILENARSASVTIRFETSDGSSAVKDLGLPCFDLTNPFRSRPPMTLYADVLGICEISATKGAEEVPSATRATYARDSYSERPNLESTPDTCSYSFVRPSMSPPSFDMMFFRSKLGGD